MSPNDRRLAVGHILYLYPALGKPEQAAVWQKKLDQLAKSRPSNEPKNANSTGGNRENGE
jgi:hypothetical protein